MRVTTMAAYHNRAFHSYFWNITTAGQTGLSLISLFYLSRFSDVISRRNCLTLLD
jgi:hypothetical protein